MNYFFQDLIQARKNEEDRLLKEAQLAKELADQEEKARTDVLRAEREIVKKNMKKERKIFRDHCKANNYYISKESQIVDNMSAVEKICEMLKLVELQDLNKTIAQSSCGKDIFDRVMNETEAKLDEERSQHSTQKSDKLKEFAETGPPKWSPELVQVLIKSVNFFPAGTNQRWEVVANFVNQHGIFDDHRRFSSKDVLSKAKDLQSSDFSKSSLKVAANQEAFDKFEKEKKKPPANAVTDDISMSFDANKEVKKPLTNGNHSHSHSPSPAPEKAPSVDKTPKVKLTNGDVAEPIKRKSVEKEEKKDDSPWSKMEQSLLEQAIKTYPVSTPERWDRIAECIPNRNKKDCMKRFKELVDLVKAKKQAAMISK